MTRWLPAACVVLLAATVSAQRRPPVPLSADLVELDVVVLDKDERPITDLRQEDFKIKEDGRLVEVKTFAPVKALGTTEPDDARVVTLLMDDIGVPVTGTTPMQQIAPAVLAPLGDGDELSVVRLASRTDEAFGDVGTALERIAGYRGGAVPFTMPDAPETMLRAVTKIAGQLESIDHRRKVIICLGLPVVCDVSEPSLGSHSRFWPAWTAAIAAAARANVSVYCIDPTGVRAGRYLSGDGLVELTGGRTFAYQNRFAAAGEAVWREAGHYYLIGYWPAESKNELRSIDVSVARKGARVHARKRR